MSSRLVEIQHEIETRGKTSRDCKRSRDQLLFQGPANDYQLLFIHNHVAIMRSIVPLLSLSALLVPIQALYFYIDGTAPKCFFEELPKDTMVVGDYTAEEYDEQQKAWKRHDGLNIFISVDVCLALSLVCLPSRVLSNTN